MNENKQNQYQLAVVFSVLFALIGFSYNVWRMELSEQNNNTRTACFEILLELSELEQLVYAAHYDQDPEEGNPRIGWIKVGLIQDLSILTSPAVTDTAKNLKATWSDHWNELATSRSATDSVVSAIESVRSEVKLILSQLE